MTSHTDYATTSDLDALEYEVLASLEEHDHYVSRNDHEGCLWAIAGLSDWLEDQGFREEDVRMIGRAGDRAYRLLLTYIV